MTTSIQRRSARVIWYHRAVQESPRQSWLPLRLADLDIRRGLPAATRDEVLAEADRRPVRVAWVYANCINMARRDPAYHAALQNIEFLFNDGAGIEIAAKLAGRPVPANLVGTDWIPALLDELGHRATDAGQSPNEPPRRVFLLGSTEPVLERCRILFAERWPGLTLVGTHHGFFDDPGPALAAIQEAGPQILIVAMGVPRQEHWLQTHWGSLQASGVRVALAGGAVLDFMTGSVPRASRIWRRLRIEWLYRLLHEPRRLWRRYLLGNLVFLGNLATDLLRGRLRADNTPPEP